MIDTKKLRQKLHSDDLVDHVEIHANVKPVLTELIDRLEAAESSVAWHQRRCMALQMHQTQMREPERTMVCDIIANGDLMHPTIAGDRYSVTEKSK